MYSLARVLLHIYKYLTYSSIHFLLVFYVFYFVCKTYYIDFCISKTKNEKNFKIINK